MDRGGRREERGGRREDTRSHRPAYDRERSRSPYRERRDDRKRSRSPPRGGRGGRGRGGGGRGGRGDYGGFNQRYERNEAPRDFGGRQRQSSSTPPPPRHGDRGRGRGDYQNRANGADSRSFENESKPAIKDERMDDGPEGEDEDAKMRRLMGFTAFSTTKETKVPGNDRNYAVHKVKKAEYRQYMNRVGGFNRPLSPSRK